MGEQLDEMANILWDNVSILVVALVPLFCYRTYYLPYLLSIIIH